MKIYYHNHFEKQTEPMYVHNRISGFTIALQVSLDEPITQTPEFKTMMEAFQKLRGALCEPMKTEDPTDVGAMAAYFKKSQEAYQAACEKWNVVQINHLNELSQNKDDLVPLFSASTN